MRIYVAGSGRDLARVRTVQKALREHGHEITYDWTSDIEHNGSTAESDLDPVVAAAYAVADAQAVLDARAFVLVLPQTLSIGSWVEFGIAIGTRRKQEIFSIGDNPYRTIFGHLATHVDGIGDLILALR